MPVPQSRLLILLPLLLAGGCGDGQRPSYVHDIEPTLHLYCLSCHSTNNGKTPMGGFSVDSYESISVGGNSGPVLTPGYPDVSKLVAIMLGRKRLYLNDGDHHAPMNQHQRERLLEWVERGALKN